MPPAARVRYDADDPYLVVAADKGTATFSDTANALAAEYGFWLGDAFASGGSAGYDHKKMGITARGGWECVKRHFRELGIDTQSQDFTAAGIGDMAGDVFGNGMLLSRHIRLSAAFNHQHIFLDPDPDTARSFRERERLFRLPRSSWADYDRRTISKGGGVYPRDAKEIALSPQARALLGLDAAQASPPEIIRTILKLPVDLLWNGGIGTYVKASHEANSAIGDRANDAVRVDGRELRCRVVGEGGNLGFSQLGRIEYALRGGRINTDFVDNSGGVDCSDHEVNIKILLDVAQRRRKLTRPARNRLLAEMTEDVAALVLRDNYLQSQAISLQEARPRTASVSTRTSSARSSSTVCSIARSSTCRPPRRSRTGAVPAKVLRGRNWRWCSRTRRSRSTTSSSSPTSRRTDTSRESWIGTSRNVSRDGIPTCCTSIASSARSSPRRRPTASSIGWARTSWRARSRTRARTRRRWRAPTRWRARLSTFASTGARSSSSTTTSRRRSSTR